MSHLLQCPTGLISQGLFGENLGIGDSEVVLPEMQALDFLPTSKLPNSSSQLLYQEFFQTDGSCSKHKSLLHKLTG